MNDTPPSTGKTSASRAEREAFYARIGADNLAPLWEQLHNLVTKTPRSDCQAAHWSYPQVRRYIAEATDLITAEEAERRVLILENPGCAARLPSRPRCTRACRPSCPAKWRAPTGTARRRCA